MRKIRPRGVAPPDFEAVVSAFGDQLLAPLVAVSALLLWVGLQSASIKSGNEPLATGASPAELPLPPPPGYDSVPILAPPASAGMAERAQPAVAGRTCFVTGVSGAPLYPQISGPLKTEARCSGQNLASYRPADLPARQASNATAQDCSLIVLRECRSVPVADFAQAEFAPTTTAPASAEFAPTATPPARAVAAPSPAHPASAAPAKN